MSEARQFGSEQESAAWLAAQSPSARGGSSAVMRGRLAAVPRRFVLQRHEDVTGASGTGVVAWGVLWPDGTASVRWAGERASAVFWQGGVADVEFVHGHNGATEIVWLDEGA
jgi:hypothetical protein